MDTASTKISEQVSGIKAQLVERLATVQLDADSGVVERKTRSRTEKKTTTSGYSDRLNGNVENDGNKQTGAKITEIPPGNLVFAAEEDEDDDDWDDDDVADDDFDPLQMNQSLPKDNFQGTRVFVQGLAKTSTWKDVRPNYRSVLSLRSHTLSYLFSFAS